MTKPLFTRSEVALAQARCERELLNHAIRTASNNYAVLPGNSLAESASAFVAFLSARNLVRWNREAGKVTP